jgi:hypothetical protein
MVGETGPPANNLEFQMPSFNVPALLGNKQTPWPLVRERTIPTEGPPLVDEI